nr:hypothetical protein Iba_scaffold11018CG0100 [Ipomoea batatas]
MLQKALGTSRQKTRNTYLRPKAEFKLQSSRYLVTSPALWQHRVKAEAETRDRKSQGQSQCNERRAELEIAGEQLGILDF